MAQEIQTNSSENSNDNQVWTSPEDIKNYGSTEPPCLASYDKSLYIAYKGKKTGRDNDDTKIYIAPYDGNRWGDSAPANLATDNFNTGKSPALTVFNNKLYLAYKSYKDDNLNIAYSAELVEDNSYEFWDYKDKLNFHSTKSPALTVYKDKLFMAWKGHDDDHEIWLSSSTDGEYWPDGKATGLFTDESPALAVFKDKLYIAYNQNGSNNICVAYLDDTTQKWIKITLAYTTSGAPSLSAYDDYLYLVYTGVDPNNNVVYYASSSDGSFSDKNNKKVPYVFTDWRASIAAWNGFLYMAYDVDNDYQLKYCYYPKSKLP
ncbi:MAG: hypothetical protein J0M18_17435 [Ignavibacteria bacterium]|nr:hypothetical protein [Ignavibacteria bacterium]